MQIYQNISTAFRIEHIMLGSIRRLLKGCQVRGEETNLSVTGEDYRKGNSHSRSSSLGGWQKESPSETRAASSRMIRVTSCNASQTNCKNVFGAFGGIVFEPKTSRRISRSALSPLRPEKSQQGFKNERKSYIVLATQHSKLTQKEILK